MSYNGSGVYTLPGAQLANGEIVSATENNQFRNDVASALNTAWTRDGQAPATGNIPMGSHKFTGLSAGTANGDSVRFEQLPSGSNPLAVGSGGTGSTTGAAALVALGNRTSATGSEILPAGTTAQRDGTPAAGYTRFNTDTGAEEYYNGTAWVTVADSATAATLTGTQTLTNKTLTSPVINGTGVNFSDGSIQNTAATGFGFKNRIINGAMMIDQRNAGASVTPSSGTSQYVIDRWRLDYSQTSKITAQRDTTAPAGFTNALKLTVAAAVTPGASDYFLLAQPIEGYNVADLAFGTASARTITISFKVRSSVTGTYAVAVRNGANNRSYVGTYTINSANTSEDKTVTLTGDTSGTWATDNSTGMNAIFDLGSGSNFNGTANTWAAANNFRTSSTVNWISNAGATFYITGVQLEKGSTATSFDYRPYGTELALCQRYFCRSNTFSIENYTGSYAGIIVAGDSSIVAGTYNFPVTMRTAPTLSTYNPNNGSTTTGRATGVDNFAYSSFRISPSSISGVVLPASNTAGRDYLFQFTASSEL